MFSVSVKVNPLTVIDESSGALILNLDTSKAFPSS
jgi:hypothetical protein